MVATLQAEPKNVDASWQIDSLQGHRHSGPLSVATFPAQTEGKQPGRLLGVFPWHNQAPKSSTQVVRGIYRARTACAIWRFATTFVWNVG